MFYQLVKCIKCGTGMTIDFDLTIKEFSEKEFFIEPSLLALNDEPPRVPDYQILRCANEKCGHIQKMEIKDILFNINIELSRIAWEGRKQATLNATRLMGFSTRYIFENNIKRFMKTDEFEEQPEVIKEFVLKVLNEK